MPARKVLKRTKNGRYTLGGRFISSRRAADIRKARRNPGAKKATTRRRKRTTTVRIAKANPPRRRKRTAVPKRRKRVVRIAKANPPRRKRRVARKKTATRRNPVAKRRRTTRRRRATTARRNPSTKRRAAARKAAATRARKKAARSRAAKKAAATRKRRGTGRRRRRSYGRARRNPASKRWMPGRRKGRRRTKNRVSVSRKQTRVRVKPGSRRTRKARLSRYRGRGGRYRYSMRTGPVRGNPMATLKRTLPIYGGILGIRALGGVFGHLARTYGATAIPATVMEFVPSGSAFLFATLLAPKIKLFKGKTLEGMQLGATIALLDTAVRKVKEMIAPSVASQPLLASAVSAMAGYDDMGIQGYGYGEYIAGSRRRDLPPPHPVAGYEVNEAMALDEYVASPMGGTEIEEALADSEAHYMQTGGAAGSLAKTVFSY